MKIKLLIILVLFQSTLFAINKNDGNSENKNNVITGKVIDATTNDALPFVNIIVTDLKTGTMTDFNGNFSIKLPDGKYKIDFKTLGYKSVSKIIEVQGGPKVIKLNVKMTETSQKLNTVVITGSKIRNTEQSMLALQKKSISMIDGLSSQTFKTLGVSNLTSAAKKIVGVNVQDDKYIYVRGLGDRYTKTILNKIDIPGLDPDKNTIQTNLFPTSILENILVYKTFTADLPADFTGGVVNMITKDFPIKKQTVFSFGTGFNPDMNLQSDYLTFNGGKLDFLAIDDGTYKMPVDLNEKIPYTFDNNPKLTELTKKFNSQMAAVNKKSLPNYNFSIYNGNKYNVGKGTNSIGYIASLSYKNTYKLYKNLIHNTYDKYYDKNNYELESTLNQKGTLGVNNIILNALGGITFKTKKSKYKINILHIRNGEKSAGTFWKDVHGDDFVIFKKDYLAYTQRNITNLLLNGIHRKLETNFKYNWKLSYTKSGIYDKDVRSTPYQYENNKYRILQNNEPRRIWRNLDENNYVSKIDFEKGFNKNNKILFGLQGYLKQRNYSIYSYQLGVKGNTQFTGNANELLQNDHIWTTNTDTGTYLLNQNVFNISNLYNSKQINTSAYVSGQYYINKKLKTVLGLRLEKFMVLYTGQNMMGDIKFDNDIVIDKLDLFPSVNLTYSLNKTSNLRFSYTRTTARPSFKEVSIAEIFDPLSNTTFIGNINLKPTYINNVDFRYEYFGKNSNMFAISSFFKTFKDPIELALFTSAPNNYTPRNLGSAQVYGLEVEYRRKLDFITPALKNFKLNLNASYLISKLEMYDDEYQLRLNTARTGEKVSKTRPLQGQTPYLINAGLSYKNRESGLTGSISFNTQGETLERVGGALPDIYRKPFNSLNLNIRKKIGKSSKGTISFKIENLLNNKKILYYKNYNAVPQIFTLKELGRTFSLTYSVLF